MTYKTFKRKLEKIIEKDGQFVVWTKETMNELNKNQIVLCGKDETETFTFEIIKV